MEISKGLQQEIQLVQNKLKNAIRDHQICVGKLKDDPNNADILGRIQEIQLHIVALGRCQKQVVQRLRKEVEAFKTENASEVKVSVAALLGLNNNNHITANNEATADEISEVKVVANGLDNARLAAAKEDYEEIVRNGDVARAPRVNVRKKERSLSVETLSAEEEIMEVVEVDENSEDKRRSSREPESPPPPERRPNFRAQLNFLETLGLITTSKFTELQNKRAERKRRSTANPQFVYSNWEIPTKRKRHNYLQSAANVPQTRQTTARLNGPSPPPIGKTGAAVPPPKSTSPPSRTIAKSLIPTQKATTRPNILRNMAESRVFANKSRIENGNGQMQLPSGAKPAQSAANSKTVHIPGLPLGLTIERIENDSAVCINCRNPGTLTNCDNCEANYHVSCHIISPPPPRLCPKCALRLKDPQGGCVVGGVGPSTTTKKNEELAAASYAPGVAGKAGEDPEVNKASRGLYKIGAAAKQQQQQQQQQIAGRGVNQLPSSTFLIPISSNALAGTFVQPENLLADSASLGVLESGAAGDAVLAAGVGGVADQIPFSTSLVIGHQLSRSSVTYVPQSQHQRVSYAYQLPAETVPQSYFIVKKIADPGKSGPGKNPGKSQPRPAIAVAGPARGDETGVARQSTAASHLDKLTGRLAESIARGWKKKSATRAIPGLNRIAIAPGKSLGPTAAASAASAASASAVAADHADPDDLDKSPGVARNGGASTGRHTGGNNRQRATGRTANEAGVAVERADKRRGLETGKPAVKAAAERREIVAGRKPRAKLGRGQLDSVLAGDNEPDKLADRSDEPRGERAPAAGKTDDGNVETRESRGRASGNEPVGDQQQPDRHDVAASAEHVKLEEAHLSAPPGAKLMREDDDDDDESNESRILGRLRNAARIMRTGRRRTTEDRARITKDRAIEASRQERNRPRILMRPERRSLDSGETRIEDSQNRRKLERDCAAPEPRNHNYGTRETRKPASSDTDSADEVEADPTATSREILDNRGKESSEEDDDDEDEDGDGDIDEEDDEEIVEEEDEEDEEDQEDCPILDEDINDNRLTNDRLGVNALVSPESLQVLEEFESAMLQVDGGGDPTAKP